MKMNSILYEKYSVIKRIKNKDDKNPMGVNRGILKMTGKLISVIVPIYNVDKYLERCLNSIQNQSYKDFEVLMIDDGSTDNSPLIAEKYSKVDVRFHFFQKSNGGQGSARNYGLDKSQGEYVAFVDSDDWIEKDYLLKLISCAEANQADVVMCGVERVWENGTRIRNPLSNKKEYIVTELHSFLNTVSYVSWDKLYRMELFEEIRFPCNMAFEDYATIPRVLARAKKIIGLPDILYNYYWRENSTTNVKKINRDILKAQRILEMSEMKDGFSDVLEVYFVRNVLGSLIWGMAHSYKNRAEIVEIMCEGKRKYSHLEKYITSENIRYPEFGKLIYNRYYFIAYCYCNFIDGIKSLFRPMYHKIIKFVKHS